MRSKTRITLQGAALLFLSSCATNEVESRSDFGSLRNARWQLVAFVNPGQHGTTLQPADTIVLVFDENGDVHGNASGLCLN